MEVFSEKSGRYEVSGQQSHILGESKLQPRVLIDARKLGHGGIGSYLENLLQGFVELGLNENCTLVLDPQNPAASWKGLYETLSESSRPHSSAELLGFGARINRIAKHKNLNLFHSPHYNLPLRYNLNTVITVHDLIHLQKPPSGIHPWIAKPLIWYALNKANKVLTVSQASSLALEQYFPKIKNKLRVIPNAIDPFFLNFDNSRTTQDLLAPGTVYFLAVFSNFKPHKGFEDLLQAFSSLHNELSRRRVLSAQRGKQKFSEEVKLVLVGQGFESKDSEVVKRLISRSGVASEIIILGEVEKKQLAGLYQNALALVVPSTLEGFCLPALEAQAMGARLVVRPIPALLELAVDKDIVCNDLSALALGEGMFRAMLTAGTIGLAWKRQRRLELAEKYNRKKIAEQVWQVYQEIVNPIQNVIQ